MGFLASDHFQFKSSAAVQALLVPTFGTLRQSRCFCKSLQGVGKIRQNGPIKVSAKHGIGSDTVKLFVGKDNDSH
jgi:hypothetical protein